MSYIEFKLELYKNLKDSLYENYDIIEKNILKVNETREGFIIKKDGVDSCPLIYLEDYYGDYLKGTTIMQIKNDILRLVREPSGAISEIKKRIADFEWVKPRLRVKLINYQSNQELLQGIVHELVMDLAIVPYILLKPEPESSTVLVPKYLVNEWNTNENDVLHIARTNTENLDSVVVKVLDDKIFRLIDEDSDKNEYSDLSDLEISDHVKMNGNIDGQKMYIISNESCNNGAYHGISLSTLSRMAVALKTNTLYILPSSIHEMLVVCKEVESDVNVFIDMVKEVNSSVVERRDFLSNSVYCYDQARNKIELA